MLSSPLGKGCDPIFKKRESPLPKDILCQVRSKLVPWFSRRRFYNIIGKKSWLEYLNYMHITKLSCRYCAFWCCRSWDFFKRHPPTVHSIFNHPFFQKGVVLHLNKLECPLPINTCTYAKFDWSWPCGFKKDEDVKSLRRQING